MLLAGRDLCLVGDSLESSGPTSPLMNMPGLLSRHLPTPLMAWVVGLLLTLAHLNRTGVGLDAPLTLMTMIRMRVPLADRVL